ncbi:MAG: flavoprotein [Sterolibacteriaceae bacterium]|jgi:flavoprotein|nr:flavoprotein [Sterolibacteriaceae bacterium]MBK9084309.1 flavoprotein [Sterolibacteriaceae bacterium]
MKRDPVPRLAWALTGSGHFLKESLDIAKAFPQVDLFLSKAAEEVLHMYQYKLSDLRKHFRIFRDTTASAAPVGLFYHGQYHSIVIAPATSNTVAKCAMGISDSLPTNIFAQAGKCRLPAIIFACDTEPEVTTESPGEWVTLYPRQVDLDQVERLKRFERVTVVGTVEALQLAVSERIACLSESSS